MKIAFIFILLLNISSVLIAQDNNIQKGKASFYGKKLNNRKTASGELYKRDQFVCAHKTHPFGTKLIVRNPGNNKEVVVTVIDRGPFHKGRVIDLSYIAAKELDIIRHGIALVEVYSLDDRLESFKKLLPDSLLLDISKIIK